MSTTETAPIPTRLSILHASRQALPTQAAQPERSPFSGWRDDTPTEELPSAASPAFPDVQVPSPTRTDRLARRRAEGRERIAHLTRHLRAALAAIVLAAALLTGLQLYAAAGISSARQAALEQARTPAASAAPLSGQSTSTPASLMSGQSDPKPDWVTEHTGAAYDRTNPAASPLDLPRCTASPDTPLPCLATISPSQTRAVVLEEDASLTALVRR